MPINCLQRIWEKAKKLIDNSNAITPAPGQDPEARMVLSYSGSVPHMVTPKRGEYSAVVQAVPIGRHWKFAHTQSDTVAVAEVNNKLAQFLSHKKRKKGVNVTKLLTTILCQKVVGEKEAFLQEYICHLNQLQPEWR